MSRRRGRRLERESSAGRLAHPPHSMWVVEACSVAAARGVEFVSPHYRTRVTEVYSAVACAAPAQSPSAALIGYDGTTLFHHAAYAASYTARSATRQATASYTAGYGKLRCKLRPGAVLTRQGMAMPVRRFPRAKQGNLEIRSPSPATP